MVGSGTPLRGIWFFGAALGLISMLLNHIRLARLGRQGCGVETPDWTLLLRQACDTLRLRRQVRLWQAADNPMPLTWGWWRPVVLLPAEAAHWAVPRRRVVLIRFTSETIMPSGHSPSCGVPLGDSMPGVWARRRRLSIGPNPIPIGRPCPRRLIWLSGRPSPSAHTARKPSSATSNCSESVFICVHLG
jgi:hypothetical protein